jgi:hypothetical protein
MRIMGIQNSANVPKYRVTGHISVITTHEEEEKAEKLRR